MADSRDAAEPFFPPDAAAWHTLSDSAIARRLGCNPGSGLSAEEAARRLRQYGANVIREAARRGWVRMFLAQFADFMILVLIGAAVVSGIVGDAKDTIVIVAIVVLNAVIGFIQEYRAEQAIAALRRLSPLAAAVIRAGERRIILAAELVPGDVVSLESGNAVPADLRLIETVDFKVGEAALTGESHPVEKTSETFPDDELAIGDRRNMAFSGTTVLYGRARGIVVATGMATELGKMANLLESVPETRTPLQRRLAAFGRQLAFGIFAICIVIFGIGILRDEPPLLMLLTVLSLAVAAIPEALPAVVTVLLAMGARNMARHNALIRRLPAVETLGSVTYICSDKTGTLTRNEMRASEIYAIGKRIPVSAIDLATEPMRRLVEAMALCNDVERGENGRMIGDPTEVALWLAASEAGIEKRSLESDRRRVMELPFDSERKRMTTLHADGGRFVAYTKGAPEGLLRRCGTMAAKDGNIALNVPELSAAIDGMAEDGLRVLAIACREWPALPNRAEPDKIESDLVLLGLVGLLDPPRPEAKEAVAMCRSAGITPVMITGDYPVTARAIARRLGIIGEGETILTGRDLRELSDHELAERASATRVYARVDPAQKIRIVQALQAQNQVVAMTGDGVNDAPALAHADIGVAMGKGGTDVAREAASLILLDDNFATIVAAAREGRRIYDNIRKFVRYMLTCNSAEIWTIFLAPFFGLPVPLLPIQILWINLVTDGLPSLALAAEPAERGIMQRPPRPYKESVFAHGIWQHIIWAGLFMAGVTLLTQAYALHIRADHWQTMVFTVLSLSQMSHVLAIRSERESLVSLGFLSNRPLLGAVSLTVLLQLMTIYVPALNPVFSTAPLTAGELGFCVVVSATVFAAVEIEKWLRRRRFI